MKDKYYPVRDWRDDMENGTFDRESGGPGSPPEPYGLNDIKRLLFFCAVWTIVWSVVLPIFAGGLAVLIQCFLYLKNGVWPVYTIVDLLSFELFNVAWAKKPETMFGLHHIFASVDLWMLLPAGLVWAGIVFVITRTIGFIMYNSR